MLPTQVDPHASGPEIRLPQWNQVDDEVRNSSAVLPHDSILLDGVLLDTSEAQQGLPYHDDATTAPSITDTFASASFGVDRQQIFEVGLGSLSDDLDLWPMLDGCAKLDFMPFYSDKAEIFEEPQTSMLQPGVSGGRVKLLFYQTTIL